MVKNVQILGKNRLRFDFPEVQKYLGEEEVENLMNMNLIYFAVSQVCPSGVLGRLPYSGLYFSP